MICTIEHKELFRFVDKRQSITVVKFLMRRVMDEKIQTFQILEMNTDDIKILVPDEHIKITNFKGKDFYLSTSKKYGLFPHEKYNWVLVFQ